MQIRIVSILAATLLCGVIASADVRNEQKAFRVIVQNGKEVLEPEKLDAKGKPVLAAKPGDIIEYRLTIRNSDQQAYHNVREDLPIPAGAVLLLESAVPAVTHASADGRTYGPFPLKKTSTINGKRVEEPLPAAAYRAVRWTIDTLPPGATLQFRVRVRVK